MKQILTGLIAIVAIFVVYNLSNSKTILGAGSTTGGAYQASTTDSTYANSQRQFKTGQGVLGSVVVTGTSATAIEIMNATSTTDLSSTTIAKFPASPTTGTYVFDAGFDRGLRINFLGSFAGNYVITTQ